MTVKNLSSSLDNEFGNVYKKSNSNYQMMGVDRTTFFPTRKAYTEDSLNYHERRTLDLVHQVLNSSSNIYQEEKNISDLFRVYGDILGRWDNGGFSKSMNDTKMIYDNKGQERDFLHNLINNKSDSFVIKPLYSNDHAFSAVVRKTDDNFSFTVVNKGGREPHRAQYEEYIVKPANLEHLLSELKTKITVVSIEEIYKTFEAGSDKKIKLNVQSKNQKMGNCYIKEPENAIKFAFTTRKFSPNMLAQLRNHETNKYFKPKWGVETGGVHRLFVEQLRRENPSIKNELTEELETYQKNKSYRSLLKENIPNLKSFDMGFNADRRNDNFPTPEKYKRLLLDLNLDTFNQNPTRISEVVNKIASYELEKSVHNISAISSPMQRATYTRYGGTFERLNDVLKNTQKDFPWLVKEIKLEMHLQYFIEGAEPYMTNNWMMANKIFNKANELYPNNTRVNLMLGITNAAMGEVIDSKGDIEKGKEFFKRALENLNDSIRLKPDFAEGYYFRSMVHGRLGDYKKAEDDLNMALKLGFDPFKEEVQKTRSFIKSANTVGKKVMFEVIKQIKPELYNQLKHETKRSYDPFKRDIRNSTREIGRNAGERLM